MILIIILLLAVVIILLLFILISAFFFTIDLFLDLPYVATKREKIETIIKFANIKRAEGPEGTRRRETVVDLGSGDGRLLFAAAQKGAIAIGYEINPILVWLTKIKIKLSLRSANWWGKVIVKRQSLWKSQADLKKADVIFVYAYKKTMQKFEDVIFQNAKKGTRVVVNTNPFPTKKPLKSENGIFLYKV